MPPYADLKTSERTRNTFYKVTCFCIQLSVAREAPQAADYFIFRRNITSLCDVAGSFEKNWIFAFIVHA